MTRTLYRRLERLEEQTMPTDELKVWQIVLVNSDGTQTLGEQIEWPSCGVSAPACGFLAVGDPRFRQSQKAIR
jgi:hypothetical protein